MEDRENPADRKVSFKLQTHKLLSCTLEDTTLEIGPNYFHPRNRGSLLFSFVDINVNT